MRAAPAYEFESDWSSVSVPERVERRADLRGVAGTDLVGIDPGAGAASAAEAGAGAAEVDFALEVEGVSVFLCWPE